jgi:hypothetical protein
MEVDERHIDGLLILVEELDRSRALLPHLVR